MQTFAYIVCFAWSPLPDSILDVLQVHHVDSPHRQACCTFMLLDETLYLFTASCIFFCVLPSIRSFGILWLNSLCLMLRSYVLPMRILMQTDKLFLYEKFGPFGPVLSVKVLANEQGQCKGVGFVNFGDADSAARAVQHMNGAAIGDRRLFVALQTHGSR